MTENPEEIHFNNRVSFSSMSNFKGCNFRWYNRYILKRSDPRTIDSAVGNFVHSALEILFALPVEERTAGPKGTKGFVEPIYAIVRASWDEFSLECQEEFQLADAALREIVKQKVDVAMYSIETDVEVHSNELKLQSQFGENDKYTFTGYVDRIDVESDGTLSVHDYKTGKRPVSMKYTSDKRLQIMLYAHFATEQLGKAVSSASLMFFGKPYGRLTVLTPKNERQKALNRAVKIASEMDKEHKAFNEYGLTQTFRPKTSPLCEWCPYIKDCEEGKQAVLVRINNRRVKENSPAYINKEEIFGNPNER